ncbi:MAG: hypothetical protein H0U52_11110 [Chloroflexi bacterium]|nr:hypothetical protein [Chloroflexota bacterium]
MNDSPRSPVSGDRPATPRWVKGLGIGIVAVLLLVVIVMVLNGGQHGPGMHTGMSDATGRPCSAAGRGTGDPAVADQAARSIDIIANDSLTVAPYSVSVAAGETVTFVVTNAGRNVHEFTVGDEAMQREHADAMAHMPAAMSHELPNSIALQPGDPKRLTWRFGQAGSLVFGCHEPGHYDAGMHDSISVS